MSSRKLYCRLLFFFYTCNYLTNPPEHIQEKEGQRGDLTLELQLIVWNWMFIKEIKEYQRKEPENTPSFHRTRLTIELLVVKGNLLFLLTIRLSSTEDTIVKTCYGTGELPYFKS